MLSDSPHIVFAGGGTAGHLFPGLAVAKQFLHEVPRAQITFAGCGKRLQRQAVAAAGYQYLCIPCQPVPHSPWQALRFVSDNIAGYCASRWMLREQHVSMVVGLGGYSSAATVRAAVSRGLPTVLLEQNAIPGKATCWLAQSASVVCASFHQIRPRLKAETNLRFTGNPVRPEFQRLYWVPPENRDAQRGRRERRLLILGGSGGAESLNQSVPRALYKLGKQLRGWRVVHQTGSGNLQSTQELYRKFNLEALVVSFVDEMAEVMHGTDLVISRAGGTTIAELAMAGNAAILIPYPDAADDHQMENAQVLAAAHACHVIDERSDAGRLDDQLVRELKRLVANESLRQRLGEQIHAFAHPDAAQEVASAMCELLDVTAAPVLRRAA